MPLWPAGEADTRLNSTREGDWAGRGLGRKREKRTFEVLLNKPHTEKNNNNRIIANTCTEFNMCLALFHAFYRYSLI